jgi:3-phenylpropionate/cinnamic acid dioxygenase small subunit
MSSEPQTTANQAVPDTPDHAAAVALHGRLAPADIQEFLIYEAALLDARELDAWLNLLTEDAVYWVPAEHGTSDPERRISLFYDDRSIMNDRIWRLGHPKMFSQNPPARQVRVISNIVTPEPVAADAQRVVVRSKFIMFEHRLKEQRTFGGSYEHVLERKNNDWLIARKTVLLANCEAVLWNIGVPI